MIQRGISKRLPRQPAALHSRDVRARRRTSRSRSRRFVRYLFFVAFLAVFSGGIALAFAHYMKESPRFQVRSIRVEGANVLREQAILEVAGITNQHNILFFDPDKVRQRIEAIPYVRRCEIRRAYPDMVIIRIEERMAVAALQVHTRTFEVDEEGVVLRELAVHESPEGPLITNVPDLGVVEVGSRLSQPALTKALALWIAFSSVSLGQELTVSEIAAPSPDDLSMICEELGYELRWGRSDFLQQALLLDILWREKSGRLPCAEYLDLRFDYDLVCK